VRVAGALGMSDAGDRTYDAILLGSGHNALVLQAYLAKAGLSTLCLERNAVAGGGLTTVERPAGSGFRHNIHSFFHRGVTQMPWYRDLEMERHGASYIEPELNVALLLSDGRAIEWWTDFDRTADSFAEIDAADARALRRWRDDFLPIVADILTREAQAPPVEPAVRRARLESSAEGRLLLATSELSPLEFVQREFRHPAVRAGLLFFNGLREVDLRLPGFGHHIPALLASVGKAQMCVGGSARLADALVSAVEETGGRVVTNAEPRRILVEGSRAVGVETTDGVCYRASGLVASSLNPQQTLLELLEPGVVPAAWRENAADFRYNLLAPLFGLYVNLREPPAYAAADGAPHLNDALMTIVGLDDDARFDDIVESHERGAIPPPVMWGASPTRLDASQAPDGLHTAFMWEKLPYRLDGDAANWDAAKEGHGARMLDVWARYAPNLRAAVIESFTLSPVDTQRHLPNMRDGDLLVGAYGHGQVGYDRPFPGAGHYRTCVDGLYLCGSCCHPGGNITGLPGHNAAQVILSDFGLAKPGG
jgi:phytoene dehydrogenase-like protein